MFFDNAKLCRPIVFELLNKGITALQELLRRHVPQGGFNLSGELVRQHPAKSRAADTTAERNRHQLVDSRGAVEAAGRRSLFLEHLEHAQRILSRRRAEDAKVRQVAG